MNNNSAVYGGAISSSNSYYTEIFNSKFYSNRAIYGAVIARLSRSRLTITDTLCYNNEAINGSVIFAPSTGAINLENNNFINNIGDYGCLIYTIQGRIGLSITSSKVILKNCNIFDNEAKNSLIYDFYGNIILNSSSFVYNNSQYPVFVINKLAGGDVIHENNWWGSDNADFTKLIYINNTVKDNEKSQNILQGFNEDCSSNIIQLDENHTVSSFRRDSSLEIPIFLDGYGEIRHEKFDGTYFLHILITDDGWVLASGGIESPYHNEKIEAISKIMMKNNNISEQYLKLIYTLKSKGNWGHYIIKAPDGRYAIVDYFEGKGYNESGILKSGEYILCPNNYELHKKGNVSDFNRSDYVFVSRYLAGIDAYGQSRTTIQTFE